MSHRTHKSTLSLLWGGGGTSELHPLWRGLISSESLGTASGKRGCRGAMLLTTSQPCPTPGRAPTSPIPRSTAVPVPGAAPWGAGSGCQEGLLPQGRSVWGEAIAPSHRAGTGRIQGEQEPGEGSTSPAACTDTPGPRPRHGLPTGPRSIRAFRAIPARAGRRME